MNARSGLAGTHKSVSPFAQDESDIASILATLAPYIRNARDLNWMVLIDRAFDDGQPWSLPGFPFNCYRSLGNGAELASVAPTLFEIGTDDSWPTECEPLLRHCSGRPMLSILASGLDASALCDYWAPLHRVRTTEGWRRPLRFADSHALALLAELLTPAQWKAYAAPLAHWFYIDRKGRLARCAAADEGVAAATDIEIDDAQFARLMDESDADTLYAHLAEGVPEDFPPELKPSQIHAELQRVVDLAALRGVDGFPDQIALGHSTLITRGRTSRDPALDATLQAGDWQAGALDETLMRLGLME